MIRRSSLHCAFLLATFSSARNSLETSSSSDFWIQNEVHLQLEPSSSRIHAVTMYLEAPGMMDLSLLQFSSSFHSAWVEYAVVPVEFMTPVYTTGQGQCEESGCDFTPDTDWIVEMGVGTKVNDTYYQWCSNESGKSPGWIDTPQLIRDDSLADRHRYNKISIQAARGREESTTNPKDAKITFEDPSESGYYAILFANCQETHGQTVTVEGTLAWTTRPTSELSFLQATLAPLGLLGILAVVYYTKEKEGRLLLSEDAYNASARNAGYMSLPMMDLSPSNR